MSEKSEREKAITFTNIRESYFDKMVNIIENCDELSKLYNLKQERIPNIIITYNNKIIALEKEFKKAGIDFYDNTECESRFIIEFQLQSLIISAFNYINYYISELSVSETQANEFINSFKRPSFFERTFKGAKYAPKTSLLTPKQKQKAISFLKKYVECNNAIYSFSLKDNMEEAISLYRNCAVANGFVSDKAFNTRIEKIHSELKLLGYDNF